MTEHEFIDQLSQALRNLPESQREDILGEYRSHFFEAKERGKNEEDIALGFGDPRSIAHTYVADYHFNEWQAPTEGQGFGAKFTHLARGLLVLMSLLFFNFFFMLWPILVAALILISAWLVTGIVTIMAAFLAVIGLIGGAATLVLPNVSAQFALFFYSLGTGIFGVIIAMGLYWLSQLMVHGVLRYIKLNVNLVAS